MKIALVSPYDYAYASGVNIHIQSLERQLNKMGHQVKVIAPSSAKIDGTDDKFIRIGRPVPVPAGGTICRVTVSLRLANRIKEVLAREKFDIIHLHEPFVPMLCSAVLRFSDSLNIGTFHAFEGKPGYNLGWPFGRILLWRRSHKLAGKIAVSEPAREYASKYVPGHYDIIPNGIDMERFSSDVSPIDEYCDGKLNILFVGRLEQQKGLGYLLKAYKQVKREISNSRLIVVGPGTRLRPGYERQVLRDGLSDVVFVGGKSQEELPRYYKTADVFCSPATGLESFGIVLLEAMAVGKPIVATDIEGYASVLTHGREGLMVPPRDVDQLAGALIRFMKDEKLRREMGQRGLLTARNYSWERVAHRITDYYQKIMDEAGETRRQHRSEAASVLV